jgi:hypothetical protein
MNTKLNRNILSDTKQHLYLWLGFIPEETNITVFIEKSNF